jgi:DNA-binding MarR family transcriptional regulator
LSSPRLSALSVIVFAGPLTLGALAEAEQVRRPTMSRVVADLERDGFVAREPNPADGRAPLLRATPAGALLIAEGRSRRTTVLAGKLAALPAADLATLERAAAILERLTGSRHANTDEEHQPPRVER